MLKTITPLLEKANELNKIKEMFNVNFTLLIVPKVRYDESIPILYPSEEIIKFCYETGTKISYDLYVSCLDSYNEEFIWDINN